MRDIQLKLPGMEIPEASLSNCQQRSVYQQEQVKGFRVKDLPNEELPRSQVLNYGVRNRTTAELLTVMIGPGNGSRSAIEIAQALLAQLETTTDEGALKALRDISAEELQHVEGVGPSKAAAILAAVELGKRPR